MVTNVTSLLKTVKAVEDEATKGTRALESTIEHIRQELAVSKVLIKKQKNKTLVGLQACAVCPCLVLLLLSCHLEPPFLFKEVRYLRKVASFKMFHTGPSTTVMSKAEQKEL